MQNEIHLKDHSIIQTDYDVNTEQVHFICSCGIKITMKKQGLLEKIKQSVPVNIDKIIYMVPIEIIETGMNKQEN
jgi:hypothetical protein